MVDRIQHAPLSLFSEALVSDEGNSFVCQDFALSFSRDKKGLEDLDFSAPFLVENLHLILLRQGRLSVHANLQSHSIEAPALVLVGQNTIYQIESVSDDISTDILIVSTEVIRRIRRDGLPMFMQEAPCFAYAPMSDDRLSAYDAILRSLLSVSRLQPQVVGAIEGLLATVVSFVDEFVTQHGHGQAANRQQEIFLRFLHLVNRHCKEHRELSFYADKMTMAQGYLSRVVSCYSGTYAKEWIERAVLLEAKVMLRHTEKTIGDISFDLGFPNESFFCKYFHRLIGQTPREFRLLSK